MRELIGKIPSKYPNVTDEVYLSETVRCQLCGRTVPIGIEVITARKDGSLKKILYHGYYCRADGLDYETRAQSVQVGSLARQRDSS